MAVAARTGRRVDGHRSAARPDLAVRAASGLLPQRGRPGRAAAGGGARPGRARADVQLRRDRPAHRDQPLRRLPAPGGHAGRARDRAGGRRRCADRLRLRRGRQPGRRGQLLGPAAAVQLRPRGPADRVDGPQRVPLRVRLRRRRPLRARRRIGPGAVRYLPLRAGRAGHDLDRRRRRGHQVRDQRRGPGGRDHQPARAPDLLGARRPRKGRGLHRPAGAQHPLRL